MPLRWQQRPRKPGSSNSGRRMITGPRTRQKSKKSRKRTRNGSSSINPTLPRIPILIAMTLIEAINVAK